jgi:hypothetical protein
MRTIREKSSNSLGLAYFIRSCIERFWTKCCLFSRQLAKNRSDDSAFQSGLETVQRWIDVQGLSGATEVPHVVSKICKIRDQVIRPTLHAVTLEHPE